MWRQGAHARRARDALQQERHLAGPADAVARAEKRVLDISGQIDVVANERAKADALRKEKDALFDQANRTQDRQNHHFEHPKGSKRAQDSPQSPRI